MAEETRHRPPEETQHRPPEETRHRRRGLETRHGYYHCSETCRGLDGQMVGMDTDQATEASSSHQNSLPTSNAGGSDVPLPGGPSEKGVAGGAGVSASVLVRRMLPGDVDAV